MCGSYTMSHSALQNRKWMMPSAACVCVCVCVCTCICVCLCVCVLDSIDQNELIGLMAVLAAAQI